jgi:hypothetical protein
MEGHNVEQAFIECFFARGKLSRILAALCTNDIHSTDPITTTTLTFMNMPVQIQLTAVGLQPFTGRDATFAYNQMTTEQQEFLLTLLKTSDQWHTYHNSMRVKWNSAPHKLDPVDVLEPMCLHIMSSALFTDRRSRLALCNIILQRIQASCPLVASLQANLNERLFPTVGPLERLVK